MSPTDIADLFPPDKQLQDIAGQIRGLNRENAPRRLAEVCCAHCRTRGRFALFDRGPHQGIRCQSCGAEHPFRPLRVMWLPKEARP